MLTDANSLPKLQGVTSFALIDPSPRNATVTVPKGPEVAISAFPRQLHSEQVQTLARRMVRVAFLAFDFKAVLPPRLPPHRGDNGTYGPGGATPPAYEKRRVP